MRIAYVAGFFKHVLPELQKGLNVHLESGAVVWIPPYGRTDELNVNRFKGEFLGAVSRGARNILICLFYMRGKPYILQTVQGIVDLGKSRSPGLIVEIEHFKNARDSAGVLAKIVAFEPGMEVVAAGPQKLPDNLEILPDWILEHHRDKVLLHPRALNAAKKSRYEDVGLIYSAIDLLGNEYWNMRTSMPENVEDRRNRWKARLKELGLELSPAINSSQAGEQGDTYKVSYPVGTDQKRLLELHLCKGSDREERLCLRIIFFGTRRLRRPSLDGSLAISIHVLPNLSKP